MLVMFGVLLVVGGCLILLAARIGLPLGRLPGDVAIRGKRFAFYAPVTTCLVISVVLSLLMWLISYFRR